MNPERWNKMKISQIKSLFNQKKQKQMTQNLAGPPETAPPVN